METKPKLFIIPWDFSPVAENALKHALKLYDVSGEKTEIELVHVLSNKSGLFSKTVKITEDEAAEKLKADQKRIRESYGVEVNARMLDGNLFDAISEYASEQQADMVIMGTHGIKGVQKLTGSWALKVIAGSDVPFLVVQDEPKTETVFKRIVMSIGFRDDEKEKIQWAITIASRYGSKINIIIPNAFDSGVQRKINNNIAFAKRHFEGHDIEWELHDSAKGRAFQEEVVNLAEDIEADLILVMTTPNLDLTDYVFGAQEQYIIANNAHIPVLCVNPGTMVQ